MPAILAKLKSAYDEGRLRARVLQAARARARPYRLGLKHLFYNPAGARIAIHAPAHVPPSQDPAELALVKRIFASFRRMKDDQRRASDLYQPSSIWQAQLDRAYSSLSDSLRSNDLSAFHFFLANFGSWDVYHGVESATFIRQHARHIVGRRYLANAVFHRQLLAWQWYTNHARPVSALSYPTHGNQVGAHIDRHFVGRFSFRSEAYASMLGGLLSDVARPIVADLGAGYGRFVYFLLRDRPRSCFVDFDLPETLCLAAYFLIKTWPDKRTLLYGEQDFGVDALASYDLILMPSYEIARLGDRTIDLFINQHSLGEMTAAAVSNYLDHIVRSTRYFFHMNHERRPNVYAGGSRGLLGGEYPVPPETFRALARIPDFWKAIDDDGRFDRDADIFVYLYERK